MTVPPGLTVEAFSAVTHPSPRRTKIMGRFITCGKDIVWKYAFGAQPAELNRIRTDVGVGEHNFIKYDEDGYPEKWKAVDPSKEPFEAEVINLTNDDIKKMKIFVNEKVAKPSIFKRLFGKKEPPDYFVGMLAAIVEYANERDSIELHGEK